jgi:hypothetical protein
MSRDGYSHDPQELEDESRREPSPRTKARASDPREDRSQGGGEEDAAEVPQREPQPAALKPEPHDSPRAYYDRDRIYLLRESESHSLEEVGKFRVIVAPDLAKFAYGGDTRRMERDIRRLKEASLVTDRTLEISRKKTLRVLTLTKQGHRLLRKNNLIPDDQPIYHGLTKPREVKHDAVLYRLYQKEADRIQRTGGRPVRVLLDYEIKRHLNRELATLGADRENRNATAKQEIAERHGLAVVDGKVAIPDLRIEYQTADLETRHVDLDLVTRDYRSRGLAQKAKAGFSLYSPADDVSRLRRVLDDREITAAILSL